MRPSPNDAAYHEPETVEALMAQNVRTIVELENAAKASRSSADRVADFIARFCGSMTFVWVHVLWFGGWIIANTFFFSFDKFPFIFLTLVVSLEAIFLSTFILISQNHENRLTERRNQLDLQINLLTEQENTKILRMLESIAQKLGADIPDDPSLHVLDQATQPEELLAQIDAANRETEAQAANQKADSAPRSKIL